MAMFVRAKRVSDPLDDGAKARLLSIDEDDDDRGLLITAGGYASSGSEHGADGSSLIHAFFDLDGDSPRSDANAAPNSYASDDDDSDVGRSRIAEARETLQGLLDPDDQFGLRLRGYAIEAAEENAGLRSNGGGHRRRRVAARLREAGYDAGVCKAKWESGGGLTAGSYECVDVVVRKDSEDDDDDDQRRYIVDLDFAPQFAVARSTTEYEELVAALPEVMVARAEAVERIVREMAEAAEAALRSRGLSVPPWRKRRYMLAKWFGPYRRTVNPLPTSAAVSVPARGGVVQCRAVGFESLTRRVVPPVRGTT